MLKYSGLFTLIILLNVTCSKESATNNNASGNTGTGGSLAKFLLWAAFFIWQAGLSLMYLISANLHRYINYRFPSLAVLKRFFLSMINFL
jgi:hypothetical protein